MQIAKPNLNRILTDIFRFEAVFYRLNRSDGRELKCAVSGTFVFSER